MKFKVTFWDGGKEQATTKKQAVIIVDARLKTSIQEGEKILWTQQRPEDKLLCAAFLIDRSGNASGVSALIEEIEQEREHGN